MKIKIYLNIIFLSFYPFFSLEAIPILNNKNDEKIKDTLKVDNSSIQIRSYNKLKEKYTEDVFKYQQKKENSGLWSRFKKRLNYIIYKIFNIEEKHKVREVTDWSIIISAVMITLLIIFFIFKAIINDEGQWGFGKSSNKNIIQTTDIENNIHEVNFKALINKAESSNNYRLAIRYYYLMLLKQLTLKEIIEYNIEKTDTDYQNEIDNTTIKKKFSYTSYIYNYIWYGEFEVNFTEFKKAKEAFNKFIMFLEV